MSVFPHQGAEAFWPGSSQAGRFRARAPAAVLLSAAILLLVAPLSLWSQDTPPAWNPVSPDELALRDDPDNPGAPAIVLDREEYVDDINNYLTVYFRIKILTEEGKRFGDVEIPYYADGAVDQIRARTVRSDGEAFEFQGEVYEKIVAKSKSLKIQEKAFTLPALAPGCVIEYSYRRTWRRYLPEVILNSQRYLITRPISVPTVSWIIHHELYTRYARFRIRPIPPPVGLQWSGLNLPQGSQVMARANGTYELEVRDVRPIRKESHMPPEDLLTGAVHFYYILGFTGSPESFWADYARREAADIDQFIGHDKGVERIVKQNVTAQDSVEHKARKLYEWVQQVRNLSFETSRTRQERKQENLKEVRSVGDIVSRGYASGNEINLLYLAVLRAAGVDAYAVRVADRRRRVFYPTVPDPSQLDAMVVMVQGAGKPMFLDPADRLCGFGVVPWNESGVTGVRLATSGDLFVQIPGQGSDLAVQTRAASLKLDADGTLSGQMTVTWTGLEALARRLQNFEDDESGRRKAIEDEIKGWLPSSAHVELLGVTGWDDSESELRADCRIALPGFALLTQRRLLLPVAVFDTNNLNPFLHAVREYPVHFRYAHREVDKLSLELPPGFKVEALPVARHEGNQFYKFETSLLASSKSLEFQRTFSMDGFYFSVEHYPQLRAAYDKVMASDAEKVVLLSESRAAR